MGAVQAGRRSWAVGVILAGLVWAAAGAVLPAQAPASGQVTLRVIVTGTQQEARQVVTRLQRGDDFAAVAREVSIDPSAASGGLLGRIARASLRRDVQAALQGREPGAITDVVSLPTGFAVFRIEPEVETPAAEADVNPALSASGSVKYVLEISGFPDARTALEQYDKLPGWNLDPRTICTVRRDSIASMRDALQRRVTAVEGGATAEARDLMQTHTGLGMLLLYDARMEEAIAHLEQAHRIAVDRLPDARAFLEQSLGVAHLHAAARENGVPTAPGVRSLIMDTPPPAYATRGHVEKAVEHFLAFLALTPGDLEARWLLNLAYRALGRYPDGVPPQHLIPPQAFASGEDVGRFRDIAPRLGLDTVAAAGGLIVDDFTNDGSLDVVSSSMDSCTPMRLFTRGTDGRFVERTEQAGLTTQFGGLNLLQADYDNDGCLDILLLRGGWDVPQRKSLLRNNCDGTFTDVTVAAGLATPVTSTQTAVWFDFDNDGFLDLFVGNEGAPAQLFLNMRNGTFMDVATAAGVARSGFIKGVTAGDFDNDGWMDLYVSNLSGDNTLYRNTGAGTFADVTARAGVADPPRGFATWFFDYDNDGWLDIFATSYFLSVDESARTYLGLPNNAATLKLYRNQRDGTFADVTRDVGLDKVYMPMGANFGDIDNDGWLDIYLGTGSPSYAALVPSVLLRNRDGQAFVDVTSSSGTGELGKGHGVAFADLDNDGDEEIVFQVGGATPGDAHAFRVFDNPGHGHNWLEVSLVGVKSNRSAMGARITVTAQLDDGTVLTMHRVVSSGGSFGASPLRQHIGIGKASRITSVEIWWPTSNTRQRFDDVGVNQWIQITELESAYVTRPRPLQPTPAGTEP